MPDLPKSAPLAREDYSSVRFRLAEVSISLADFQRFVRCIEGLVGEVALATTRTAGTWVITDLRYGSATIAVAPADDIAGSYDVVQSILDGLGQIEAGGDKPPFFSIQAVRYAEAIARLARSAPLEVSTSTTNVVGITKRTIEHARNMLLVRRSYFGSVTGYLETVSVHRGGRVAVYGDAGQVVRCRVERSLLTESLELFGKRVVVSGRVSINHSGIPLSIDAEDIFAAPRPVRTKPVSAFFGAIPDISLGLSSPDYLRSLWEKV